MADTRLEQKELSQRAHKIIGYFAQDTIDKIFEHIDRLDIRDTGTLRSSIRAYVHQNAGGKEALVEIFYAYYGDMVEQAVGRYWGVDADLTEGTGVAHGNIKAPEIDRVGYGPMRASFSGLPRGNHGRLREIYHRPRPFLRSEINRQIDRIGYRLMRDLGDLIDIHTMQFVGQEIYNDVYEAMIAPFAMQGANIPRVKVHFPNGQTQEL